MEDTDVMMTMEAAGVAVMAAAAAVVTGEGAVTEWGAEGSAAAIAWEASAPNYTGSPGTWPSETGLGTRARADGGSTQAFLALLSRMAPHVLALFMIFFF